MVVTQLQQLVHDDTVVGLVLAFEARNLGRGGSELLLGSRVLCVEVVDYADRLFGFCVGDPCGSDMTAGAWCVAVVVAVAVAVVVAALQYQIKSVPHV